MLNYDQIQGIRSYSSTLIGRKIQLIHTSDPYTLLQSGSLGVIDHIDDAGTIFAKWEDGSTLGLIPTVDQFRIIYD